MLIQADLDQFIGTDTYHRWSTLYPGYVLTDGAYYVANHGAYWLMDLIGSWQKELSSETFQVWTLTVKDGKGKVVAEDGNGHVLATQEIPYTDFPLEQIQLFAIYDDRYMVILLLSEY